MNDCAGCRFMDEAADGALFCMHPLFRGEIADLRKPLCEGFEFEPRFFPEV